MASGHAHSNLDLGKSASLDNNKRGGRPLSFRSRGDTASKEIRDRLDKISSLNKRRSTILAQLNELKKGIASSLNEKKELDIEVKKIELEISKKTKTVNEIKRTVQYVSIEPLRSARDRLQISLSNNNFKVSEETKIVREIDKLKKNEREIHRLNDATKSLSEERDKRNSTRHRVKENMDKTSQLYREKGTLSQELNDINFKISTLKSELDILRSKTDSLIDISSSGSSMNNHSGTPGSSTRSSVVLPPAVLPNSKSTPSLFHHQRESVDTPAKPQNKVEADECNTNNIGNSVILPVDNSDSGDDQEPPSFTEEEDELAASSATVVVAVTKKTGSADVMTTSDVVSEEDAKEEKKVKRLSKELAKIDQLMASLRSLPKPKSATVNQSAEPPQAAQNPSPSGDTGGVTMRHTSNKRGKGAFRGRISFPACVFNSLLDLGLTVPASWEELQSTLEGLGDRRERLVSVKCGEDPGKNSVVAANPGYMRTNSASTTGDSAFSEMNTSRPDSPGNFIPIASYSGGAGGGQNLFGGTTCTMTTGLAKETSVLVTPPPPPCLVNCTPKWPVDGTLTSDNAVDKSSLDSLEKSDDSGYNLLTSHL